jgi:hypothetical protein
LGERVPPPEERLILNSETTPTGTFAAATGLGFKPADSGFFSRRKSLGAKFLGKRSMRSSEAGRLREKGSHPEAKKAGPSRPAFFALITL